MVRILSAALLACGVAVGWNYRPLQKTLQRLFDSEWQERSRPLLFSAEAEREEERELFVSATVMRDACDFKWLERSADPPAEFTGEIPYGSVLFVNSKHLSRFAKEVLPKLKSACVLVASCDDTGARVDGWEQICGHEKLIHCFLQNCDLPRKFEKITHLPIGLNFHKLDPKSWNQSRDMGLPSSPGNQQLTLRYFRDRHPALLQRPLKVYSNFHLNMDTFLRDSKSRLRREARTEALRSLRDKPWVVMETRQSPRNAVWERHQEISFEASPRGNGWDCHRTWEALLLGTIPIVKRSPIDVVYEGLPVVIVDSWDEVKPTNLKRWREELAPAFEGPIHPKLYSRYWIEKFHQWKIAGPNSRPPLSS